MSITPEEKKYLVEQIENLTSPRPLFYLKFCSCEKFAQDMCNGDFMETQQSILGEEKLKLANVDRVTDSICCYPYKLKILRLLTANGIWFLLPPRAYLRHSLKVVSW
jgi:hypothetical protein